MQTKWLIAGLLFFLLNISHELKAQSVIATAGGSEETNNLQVNWTIGEMITFTGETDDLLVAQGFHQPSIKTSTSNKQVGITGSAIEVYPNPASNVLNIYIADIGSFRYIVTNITGQTISIGNLQKGVNKLSIKDMPSMVYILTIYFENVKATTYHIIKQ